MDATHGGELKAVHVCAYTRIRFGSLEHVCEHYRSWPGQLEFSFDIPAQPEQPVTASPPG